MRGAAMPKPISRNGRVIFQDRPAINRLDDKDIREFLVDSHPDLQPDSLDALFEPQAEAVLVLLLQSCDESNLTDPTQHLKDPKLSVYWKLFVQKRLLSFEHELLPLLNWKGARR